MADRAHAGDLALGLAAIGLRAGDAARRAALVGARGAARTPVVGGLLRQAAGDVEAIGRDVRVRGQEALSTLLDEEAAALLTRMLESDLARRLTEEVLDSAEVQRLIEHIASSPEVRRAIATQSGGLAEEMVGDMRRRTQTLDDGAERVVRGWLRRPRPSAP